MSDTLRWVGLALGAVFAGPVRAQATVEQGSLPDDGWLPVFTAANADAELGDTFTTGNGASGGAVWFDADGDFWPDLFVTNGAGFDHRLYRNDADGTFTDLSARVPKPSLALESAGATAGDVDNDGDTDLVVFVDNPVFDPLGANPPEGGPNLLYRNTGNATFVEDGLVSGLVDPNGRRTAAGGVVDYDRDGLLDVVCLNARLGGPVQDNDDRLVRNVGAGVFADVAADVAFDGYGRDGLACLWFDADGDGWQDVYVANAGLALPDEPGFYNGNDVLLRNGLSDVGRFCDVTGNPRVIGDDAHMPRGLDVGDVDNDGAWDLFVATAPFAGTAGHVFYRGDGAGGLLDDSAAEAGLVGPAASACGFLDVDLDGWVDLWLGTERPDVPDRIFRNRRDGTFAALTVPGFVGNAARGGASADYDGDGDLDLFVVNQGGDSILWRNDSPPGSWLQVKLIGTTSNRDAIGATVRLEADGVTQMRRVSGGDGAHSRSSHLLHFGLGEATSANLIVDWPSGGTSQVGVASVDKFVVVVEGAGLLAEQVTDAAAVADAIAGTVEVTLRTNHGGRSRLALEGLGPVRWDPDARAYRATFPAAGVPPTVRVVSEGGGAWEVPVRRTER